MARWTERLNYTGVSHPMSLEKRIGELETEVEGLREILRALELRRDIDEKLEGAIAARLEKQVQQALVQSPLVVFGKWTLGISILIGVAVWVGGSVYSGIQLKSVDGRAREVLGKLQESEKSVEQADKRVSQILEAKVEEVTQASQDALTEIDDTRFEAVQRIKEAADDAVVAVQSERQEALARLDSEELPDLRELRPEIRALANSTDRLNARAVEYVLGRWGYVLVGVNILLLLACGSLFYRGFASGRR